MTRNGLLTEPKKSGRTNRSRFRALLNQLSRRAGIATKATTRQDSHLPKGTEIIGTLFFQGPVVIDGQVEGDITGQDKITIDENGVVTADKIIAASVTIAGAVKVNTIASRLVEILATGKVRGDIASPLLSIHEGAQFEGNIRAREAANS